jgi:hypothetical protein
MAEQSSQQDIINISRYIAILLAGGFTIFGALIGSWITHFFSIKRSDRERFLNSYDSFRETFSTAIRELENADKIHVEVILDEYPKHEAAMYVFIHNLKGVRISLFRAKWAEYREAYEHYKKYRSLVNSFKTMEESEEFQYKKNILKLIHEVLELAKKY